MMCNAILQASGEGTPPHRQHRRGRRCEDRGQLGACRHWQPSTFRARGRRHLPLAIIIIVDYIFLCRALGAGLSRAHARRTAPFEPAMGGAAWAVYGLARISARHERTARHSEGAMMIVAIAAAVVVYVVMIGLTRCRHDGGYGAHPARGKAQAHSASMRSTRDAAPSLPPAARAPGASARGGASQKRRSLKKIFCRETGNIRPKRYAKPVVCRISSCVMAKNMIRFSGAQKDAFCAEKSLRPDARRRCRGSDRRL